MICDWVNEHLLPDVILYHPQVPSKISTRTATWWLHQIRFHPSASHKGVYLDEPSEKKILVMLYHDESTFHSNGGPGWIWVEVGKQPIRPKGKGRGIMVSDFIDEHNGYLHLTDEKYEQAHTVILDCGRRQDFC